MNFLKHGFHKDLLTIRRQIGRLSQTVEIAVTALVNTKRDMHVKPVYAGHVHESPLLKDFFLHARIIGGDV